MENENKLLTKRNIIIALVLFIILLSIIIYVLTNRSTSNPQPNGPVPTPEITGDFTGYVEPEFTASEQAELDQNTQLYDLSPYNGNGFTITYDYETFQYNVSAPDQIGLDNFNSFIDNNYPAIPKEKFVINGQITQSNDEVVQFLVEQMPVESSTFSVTAEEEPNLPSGYYFLVTIKDQSRGQNDFNVWLQTLNLSQAQIESLDVQIQ